VSASCLEVFDKRGFLREGEVGVVDSVEVMVDFVEHCVRSHGER
jgi:hypothetical protein